MCMKLILKPQVGNPSAAAAGCPTTSSGAALGAGWYLDAVVRPQSWSVCLAAEAGGIAEAQQLSQP